MSGTAFQKKVWGEIDKIPRGEITTYGQIAKNIGNLKLQERSLMLVVQIQVQSLRLATE